MKLVSWNVNGIRAGIKKGTFFEYLETQRPDIIGLQEIKGNIDQLAPLDIEMMKWLGYELYFNPAKRPGYSGTAILTKITPVKVKYGIDVTGLELNHDEIDEVIAENHEGRVVVAEYENFFFITVYTPNSKNDLSRLEYRRIWDEVFLKYCKYLENQKPVIFCGDLNVAHKEIDLARPKDNMTTPKKPGSAWFTDSERQSFQEIIDAEFVDTWRYFYPDTTDIYTWWSNLGGARARNVWWRIDYFMVSKNFVSQVKDAFIQEKVLGSDHCPVGILLK